MVCKLLVTLVTSIQGSAPQSEYENVRDRNIAERQQKMNELGIIKFFVKRGTKGLRYRHQLRQESQPDLPRKMMTFKHQTTIFNNNIYLCISLSTTIIMDNGRNGSKSCSYSGNY